jgi:Cu(I)/Ag(I) efflux system membrane protein CusA/SilA
MINKLIDYCAGHRFLVFLFVAVAVMIGGYSMQNTKLDAIPDLSDTQVIIYSRWDRSPDIMEDQVTYPIISALLGMPKVKDIRGFSDFGYSYVYVIFEDGADLYWARSRTLEYLNAILPRLLKASRPSWRRTRQPWDGCTNTRWWIQRGSEAWPRCAASRTGICATHCRRCREWPK